MTHRTPHTSLKLLLAAALASAMLAVPSFALADGPMTAPQTIRPTETFETPLASDWAIVPLDSMLYLSTANWGRTSRLAHTGSWGLWCAGLGGTWPYYPSGSYSRALLSLPQLANYYASTFSFSYNMASLGDADASSFGAGWMTTGPKNEARGGLPMTTGWTTRAYDLSAPSNTFVLSRTAGKVFFQWQDLSEGPTQYVQVGSGPTVDDVALTGWMFGPVRELSTTETPSGPMLTWTRPALSTISSAPDNRALKYRIWRRAVGSTVWTEMVPGGLPSAATAVAWTDTAVASSVSCDYAVQAWQSPSGTGYGQLAASVRRTATSAGTLTPVVTALRTAGPSSYLNYATTASFTGTLKDAAGVPLVGRSVVMSYSYDGTSFKTLRTLTTGAGGAFATTDMRTVRTWYKFSFATAKGASAQGADLLGSSSTRYVWWRPSVSAPSAGGRTTFSTRTTYTWTGVLKPWHSTTSASVYLMRWRWNGARWVKYSTIKTSNVTVVSGASKYTRYTTRLKLAYAGKWRIQAIAVADSQHPSTTSSVRTVTVR